MSFALPTLLGRSGALGKTFSAGGTDASTSEFDRDAEIVTSVVSERMPFDKQSLGVLATWEAHVMSQNIRFSAIMRLVAKLSFYSVFQETTMEVFVQVESASEIAVLILTILMPRRLRWVFLCSRFASGCFTNIVFYTPHMFHIGGSCGRHGALLLYCALTDVILLPFTIPEYRLAPFFSWSYLTLFLTTHLVQLVLSDIQTWVTCVGALVSATCLTVTACISLRQRKMIENSQQAMFLLDLKQRLVVHRMFNILQYTVPKFVVEPLLQRSDQPVAEHISCASILFAAVDGFDIISITLTPPQLLDLLNCIFTHFDNVCTAYGVTKIETVGEEYVCAVGITPDDLRKGREEGHGNILGNLVKAALAFLEFQHNSPSQIQLSLKMGIHTGPVVAGVVGRKLPRFRLFGDTVNTAARMMQKSLPRELQFGDQTREELPSWAAIRQRGFIEMKGKGAVMTYTLDQEISLRSLSQLQEENQAVVVGLSPFASGAFDAMHNVIRLRRKDAHLDTKMLADCERVDALCDRVTGQARLRTSWCLPFLHMLDFGNEEAKHFRNWFRKAILKDSIASLLRDGQIFFLVTIAEAIYVIVQDSFKFHPYLGTFLLYRSLCALVWLLCKITVACFPTALVASRSTLLGLTLTRSVVFVLVVCSYAPVPTERIKTKFATEACPTFRLEGVVSQLLALNMFFMCVFILSTKQYRAIPAFASVSASLGMTIIGNLLPDLPGLRQCLIVCGVAVILRAYLFEISLRKRYGAKRCMHLMFEKIEGMLDSLMPPMVAHTFCEPTRPRVLAHDYKCATVAQSDLCGFTKLASTMDPITLVKLIGDLFAKFDDLADIHEIYKVETVGDAYIAGQGGQPLSAINSPLNVVLFGLGMVNATHDWAKEQGMMLTCRVGVHSGECVGGIVGKDMQRYHLFGDLMTTLEVLESTAPEGRVHISLACKEAVEEEVQKDNLFAQVQFLVREEGVLRTSKGSTHNFTEVGGRTYLAQEITMQRLQGTVRQVSTDDQESKQGQRERIQFEV